MVWGLLIAGGGGVYSDCEAAPHSSVSEGGNIQRVNLVVDSGSV